MLVHGPEDRLDLWKDIAAYLKRGVSTVQRWERREGMPVHRHVHDKQGSVYAFRSELDAWWESRRARLEQEEAATWPRQIAQAWTRAQAEAAGLSPSIWWLAGLITGAGAALAMALVVTAWRAPAPEPLRSVRFLVPAPDGATWGSTPGSPSPSVSPDGTRIAFVALGPEGISRVWLHAFDSNAARPLAGTDHAAYPFWSPDGQSIGFFAQGKLKTIRLPEAPPVTVCNLPVGGHEASGSSSVGGTWNAGGVILFAPTLGSGLYRVSSSGGAPVPVTTLDASRRETTHRFPQFLPDGRRFLYLVRSGLPDHHGIFVGSLDSPERKRLIAADSNAVYAAPGYLLFVREASLQAHRFDLERLEVTGEPVVLAGGVVPGPTIRNAPFSLAADVLAYRSGAVTETQLVAVDRSGRTLGVVGPPGPYPANPSLSPDGSRIAMGRFDVQSGGSDIWLFDISRGVSSRFTFDSALELAPLWAPDGKSIAFASNRAGVWDVYERHLDRPNGADAAADRRLLESTTNKYPQDWSPDGGWLLYTRWDAETGEDLWLMRADSGETRPFLQAEFDQREAQFSPDGRWVAYASNESGRHEIYVRPFGGGIGQWKVSIDGGTEPRWRGDARELFYVGPDRRLVSVTIDSGPAFVPGTPQTLFDARVAQTLWWDYVVSADGRRFVIKQAVAEGASSPMTVVLNWRAALGRGAAPSGQ